MRPMARVGSRVLFGTTTPGRLGHAPPEGENIATWALNTGAGGYPWASGFKLRVKRMGNTVGKIRLEEHCAPGCDTPSQVAIRDEAGRDPSGVATGTLAKIHPARLSARWHSRRVVLATIMDRDHPSRSSVGSTCPCPHISDRSN